MSSLQSPSTQTPAKSKPKKATAAGAFPRVTLAEVAELTNAVYSIGEGERVRRVAAFDKLGRKPDSGTSRMLVTTANSGYGLLTGSYAAEFLELTERGIAFESGSSQRERVRVAYEALMSNRIFAGIINRFKDRTVPAADVAADYVASNFGLTPEEASRCVAIVLKNIADYGLSEESSGRRIVVTPETALSRFSEQIDNLATYEITGSDRIGDDNNVITQSRTSKEPLVEEIQPQIAFNIQIQLPSDASAETYEIIFRNISQHLLRRSKG